jgi:hypothetical protein
MRYSSDICVIGLAGSAAHSSQRKPMSRTVAKVAWQSGLTGRYMGPSPEMTLRDRHFQGFSMKYW